METRKKRRVLHYSVTSEDDGFVARCLDIEVASDGSTVAEALANLEDALILYGEAEAWKPMLFPDKPIELTDEDREWLDMKPVGREIV